LEEACRTCKRLDASLMLKPLCMFPAGKALLGRVEERACQLRRALVEYSTIEGVFFPCSGRLQKRLLAEQWREARWAKWHAALTIAST
jgi:hypothetical protein